MTGLKNVINLGNSIIGVSILAMPYCFMKCGIILSIVLVICSGLLTRAACHLLLKAAIMARRRSFEFLAFHSFGSVGKHAVEIGIIGFLLGSCIAFFVVIGDLAPPLAADYFLLQRTSELRALVLIALGLFVGLPLALLRKVESLTSLSALSMAFYACLGVKILLEAMPDLASGAYRGHVKYWDSSGIMTCLPIFSMALACQTQLFEIFDTLNDPSLKRMDSVVSGAVNLCTFVYITIGFFGYIAFCDQTITGNILVKLPNTIPSQFIKFGFVMSVVISFPLCLFPCRTSLHSLMCRQVMSHHDMSPSYIPDHHFRSLTLLLVAVTLGTAIILPNIELVLGIVGSTIGTVICMILPSTVFIRVTSKNTNERLMAQVVLGIGVFIFFAGTYSTLRNASAPVEQLIPTPYSVKPATISIHALHGITDLGIAPSPVAKIQDVKIDGSEVNGVVQDVVKVQPKDMQQNVKDKGVDKRLEPPEPEAPKEQLKPELDKIVEKQQETNDGALNPDALKKEDKEIGLQKEQQKDEHRGDVEKPPLAKGVIAEKQEELLMKLERQQQEQQKILEEQKKLLQELKEHKETHEKVPVEVGRQVLPDNHQEQPRFKQEIALEPPGRISKDKVMVKAKPEEQQETKDNFADQNDGSIKAEGKMKVEGLAKDRYDPNRPLNGGRLPKPESLLPDLHPRLPQKKPELHVPQQEVPLVSSANLSQSKEGVLAVQKESEKVHSIPGKNIDVKMVPDLTLVSKPFPVLAKQRDLPEQRVLPGASEVVQGQEGAGKNEMRRLLESNASATILDSARDKSKRVEVR